MDVWEDGFGVVFYVYWFIVYWLVYIVIWFNDSEIEEGFVVIIYGEIMEGLWVWERCYVGYLEFLKLVVFIRLVLR